MGVPQGSVLGPLLFTLYTSGMRRITEKHMTSVLLYSDDSQFYMVFKALCPQETQSKLLRLEACIDEVHNWLIHSRLQLNPVKTESLVVVPPRLERSLVVPGLRVGDTLIKPSEQVRYLGTTRDKEICRSCYFHLKNIGRIRPYLTRKALALVPPRQALRPNKGP